MAKRLFTLAIMSILALSAWADDADLQKQLIPTYSLQHSGSADTNGTVTGGSYDGNFSTPNAFGWSLKSTDNYLKITKSAEFTEGEIISVVVVYNGNYADDRGITIANATSEATFTQNIILPSWYKSGGGTGAVATLRYTLTSDDAAKINNDLYILFKNNNYWIQKVEVGTSYATSTAAVSEKTWDLSKIFGNQSTGTAFASSTIYDDLFFAKSTPLLNISGNFAIPRFTSGASSASAWDDNSTYNIKFNLSAGRGIVTVYSSVTPRYYLGSGSATSFNQLNDVTETVGSDTYYAQAMTYNVASQTRFVIFRHSSSNTPIYKIVVTPETMSSPSISQSGTNEYTVTEGISNAGSLVTVSTYYTADGSDPNSSSTLLPENKKITVTNDMSQIKIISISSNGTSSSVVSQSVTYEPIVINSVAITDIAAPVKDIAFDTEAACATTGIESTSSVTWKLGDTEKTGNAEANKAYTAYITLTANSDYQFAATPTATINEAEANVSRTDDTHIIVSYTFPTTDLMTINPSVSLTGWTYGEAANTTPTVEGNTGNGAVTYQYKFATADDEAYTTFDTDHYPSAAGEYNIKANIAANGNYAAGSAVSTFTIAKAAGAVSFTTATPQQTLSATLAENTYTQAATVTGDAVPSYALSNNTCGATIEGAVVTFTQAGSVTVTATVEDTNNYTYAKKTASYTLTVNNAALTGITVTSYNAAYDGNAHGITVTCEGATIKYGETEGSYTLDASPTITNVSNSPKTVYYKVSKDNYTDVTGSSTITITPKDLTITAKAQTITQGDNISTGVDLVEVSGLVYGDALTAITLTPSTTEVTADGTITPSAAETTKGATNYNITYVEGNLTITNSAPVTHTLTVNVDDASHGSVTIIVAGEAASSGVAVAEGASVSVTATANSGYTFKNWGNTELTANPYNFTMGTSGVNLTATFEEESKVNAEQTWTFNSITTGTQYKSIVEIGNGLYIRGSNGRSLSVSESDAAETITFSDNHEEEVSKTLVAANVPNGNAPTTAGNANGILGTIALNINTAGTLYIKLKAGNFDNHTDNPRLRLQNSLGTLNQVTPTDGTTIHELKYSFENASVAYLNTAGNIFLNIYAIRFVPTPEATITADATQSKTYNGTAQALTASASAGGVTITYYTNADHSEGETTTAPTNAGTYYAIVSQSDANYTSTPVNVTFTILPKDLTITAMNQTVSIGGSITEGVGLVTTNGLVEGDELTGITLDASSTEAATESGTITPSNAVIKNSASNYNISYVTGTLTVVAGTQSYNIVVPSAVNGNSVSANPTSATEGTGITLTITTAENYTLSSINADNNVELSGSGETRTFTMPAANVTITATWTINQADTGDNATSETYTVTETGGIEVSSVTTNINSSSITIPAKVGSANVTSIANDAFDNVAKENIRSIDLSATSITGVTVNRSSGIFNGFPEETMIYMPAGNTEASGQKNVIIGGTCSDFVMTDEKSYNIPTSFTAMSATLSRSFTSDVTCTLCLPYAIPAATIASFGKIYYFSGINGTTIQMTEQTGDLEANTPYIFVPNNAATGITTTGSISVSMSDAETHNNTAKFTFKGVYEHKVFSSTEISSGVYGFAADADHGAASVGQFVKASNGAWTEGMRAYLEYSEGDLTGTASTRGEGLPDVLNVVLIHANGSTTNIGRLELMTAEDGSPVYNLNGQRVDNSYKGLVIKNGKKVVKK